ncbi:hypothetical protein E2C01_036577 [Portunus trituberculatus]|uniref:Uncharacterized protein n=1 Tax=Portunus trituberculatus TaxID=210409 RepID=A0A5B7FCU8_PORTR|nr:hypothetical protein [Portunus trituberculatus]
MIPYSSSLLLTLTHPYPPSLLGRPFSPFRDLLFTLAILAELPPPSPSLTQPARHLPSATHRKRV